MKIVRYKLESSCYEDSEVIGIYTTLEEAKEEFYKLPNSDKCEFWTPEDENQPIQKGEDNYIPFFIDEVITVLTDEEIEKIRA